MGEFNEERMKQGMSVLADVVKRSVEAAVAAERARWPWKQVGNVLDHWEGVPNDLKSDPGMDRFCRRMEELLDAVADALPDVDRDPPTEMDVRHG